MFPRAYPRVELVTSTVVTDRTNVLSKFHPLFFSLLVAVKVKPEIISPGDLMVNMVTNVIVNILMAT